MLQRDHMSVGRDCRGITEDVQAKTKPYLYWIALVMKGVKNAKRKFQSQLDPAAREAWYDRVRVGKVSPVRIQIPGAHVVA